jgi:methionyl-tRNA formyltransferase
MAEARALNPDISVVVAYGHILLPEVLALAPGGSINVHASLLPELRGAAPVHWAILQGKKTTGVTVMRMVERMDAGPIILQTPEDIGHLAVFYASDEARMITGQVVAVDGGITLQRA